MKSNRTLNIILALLSSFIFSLKVFSQDSSYYFLKGYELMGQEKYEDAIDMFNTSIRMKNMVGYSFGYKSKCEAILLRHELSRRDLDTAFMFLPSDYLLFGFRAFQYRMLNKPDSTIYYTRKSLALKPTYTITLELMAEAFTLLEQYDSARYYINAALKIKPNDWHLVLTLGKIEMANGNYEVAILHFQYCIKKVPQNVIAKLDIANCKLMQKKFNEAIEICSSMIILYPEVQRSYYIRGLTYCELGNKNLACLDFKKLGTFEGVEKFAKRQAKDCNCEE